MRCAWAQRWLTVNRFLIEGFSLHRDKHGPIPDMIVGMVKYGGLIQVEVESFEDFDRTFHRGLLEAKRVLVNPPGIVEIFQEMALSWDQTLDLGDGMWNESTGRGKFHPKILTEDCSKTSLGRWRNPDHGEAFQPEVKYAEEAELIRRLRGDCGQTVVKIVKTYKGETLVTHTLFARPEFDQLYDELQVLRVMEA